MASERDERGARSLDAESGIDGGIDHVAGSEGEDALFSAKPSLDDAPEDAPDPESYSDPQPVRPTVRPASARSYGPPQRRTGAHVGAAKASEPEVFGVSIRAIALIAAIAAVVSVFASLAVSCGMQGMLQHSIDADRSDLEAHIDENLASANDQIDKIIDEYNSAAEAAGDAEDANADLTEAREDLRQTMADARAWLESGAGQWIGSQTQTMMTNALDSAQNLIDESGISDPQTYRDAAQAIESIIDDVEKGRLW